MSEILLNIEDSSKSSKDLRGLRDGNSHNELNHMIMIISPTNTHPSHQHPHKCIELNLLCVCLLEVVNRSANI